MTASKGRELLSIPGPTNIPDVVLAAMHRPAIDIYAGDMLADIARAEERANSVTTVLVQPP